MKISNPKALEQGKGKSLLPPPLQGIKIVKKVQINLEPLQIKKSDISKKLADQRWRHSMNQCYETLRSFVEQDIYLFGGVVIKGREVRSKNDLLSKLLGLILNLENHLDSLCAIPCESLTPQDRAYKLKFQLHQAGKEIPQQQQSTKSLPH